MREVVERLPQHGLRRAARRIVGRQRVEAILRDVEEHRREVDGAQVEQAVERAMEQERLVLARIRSTRAPRWAANARSTRVSRSGGSASAAGRSRSRLPSRKRNVFRTFR